ncbi:hypothetical protein Gotri_004253, partial [Gossypium trilobum]|nr:hypothetical protein [Gossypium trilobum]
MVASLNFPIGSKNGGTGMDHPLLRPYESMYLDLKDEKSSTSSTKPVYLVDDITT